MKRITELTEQLEENIPKILAGHLTVAEAVFSGSETYALLGSDPPYPYNS